MRKLLVLLMVALAINPAWAQRSITGKVTDEKGSPVINASVTIKGSTTGTVTKEDGTYTLTVPANATVLIFSSVNMEPKEISIGNQSTVNASLQTITASLDEVVVVGYQSIDRRDLTGAVGKISGSAIQDKPITSFDQALTGKAAGLWVNTSSGLVGESVIIRIRGAASISSGSQPLIIMDGIPLQQGNDGQLFNPVNVLADINPNDIESVEVLKDASAGAIYGSRAAGGVLLITTKKGKANQPQTNYDMFIGYNQPANEIDVFNSDQYTSVINQMRSNAGLADAANYGDIDGDGQLDTVSTDWQDEVYRNGLTQQHNLSMSGGNDRSTYFASVNYTDFENYIINNRLRRGSARLNATTKAANWLTFGANNQFSRTLQDGLGSGTGNAASGIPLGPLLYFPNVPVRDANGEFYLGQGGNTFGMGIVPNPVAVLRTNFDDRDTYRYLGSFYGAAKIIKGLTFKSQYNIDYQTSFTDQFWNPDVGDGAGLAGVRQQVNTQTKIWSWFNTLNYITKIANQHDINVLVGTEYTKATGQIQYGFGIGLNDPSLTLLSPSNYAQTGAENFIGFGINNGLASYFGTINYGFRDKYLATFNFRADASSRFGENNQFGYFPGGSVAWRISEEEFMRNNKTFTDVKLRASYGILGNNNIADFADEGVFQPTSYAAIPALILSNPGNTNLKWERQQQFDIGLDFSLWNKVDVILDYYNRKTKDLVLLNPTLATLGFPGNNITENVGKLENNGVELTVSSTNISKRDFTWTTSFNISYSKNKVTATNDAGDDIIGLGNIGIARPGEDLGTYFLIPWNGVNPETGWATWLDINGDVKQFDPSLNLWTTLKDGVTATPITAADREITGKTPYPKFYGGLSNTVNFKGFDLSVDVQYSFGFYLFNTTQRTLSNYTTQENKATNLLDAWTTPGQSTDVPKLFWNDANQSMTSTRWLEKGDFVRVRNIAIGYTIPKSAIEKIKITKLRIYVQAQNLYTFTGYNGIDPEANANGNTNIGLGIDTFRPYLPRTITIGANVSF